MPQFVPYSPRIGQGEVLPTIRLLLRNDDGQITRHEFHQETIVIGSIAGCDLRLPAADAPPLLALLQSTGHGLSLRRLGGIPPFIINDQPRETATLKSKDVLKLGRHSLVIEMLAERTLASLLTPPTQSEEQEKLTQAQEQLRKERDEWELEAEKQAEQLAVRVREAQEREKILKDKETDWERSQSARTPTENEAVRQELGRLRDALYRHYKERRDELASMREAVRLAARKVQETKREQKQRQADLDSFAHRLAPLEEKLSVRFDEVQKQTGLLEEWQQDLQAEANKTTLLQTQLAKEKETLAAAQKQHQEDLVQLHRLHTVLNQRQTELAEKQTTLTQLDETIRDEKLRLEAAAKQLRLAQETLTGAEQQFLVQQQQTKELHEAASRLEAANQQKNQELTRWEAQLASDRLRLDRLEADVADSQRRTMEEREQLLQEQNDWQSQKEQLQTHVANLQAQMRLQEVTLQAREEERKLLEERTATVELAAQENQRKADWLEARILRVYKLRQLLGERYHSLKKQASGLLETEATQFSLQETLHRRIQSLAQKENETTALAVQHQQQLAEMEAQKQILATEQGDWQTRKLAEHQEQETRRAALDHLAFELSQTGATLEARGKALEQKEQELVERQQLIDAKLTQTSHEQQRLVSTWEQVAKDLPSHLRAADTALNRLTTIRDHARGQLDEARSYRNRATEEIETLRRGLSQQQEQNLALRDALLGIQSDLKHEIANFRQECQHFKAQTLLWESRLSENQQSLDDSAHKMAEEASDLECKSSQLEIRLQELDGMEQDIAHRHGEVSRHLSDMQKWYRQKMRDLVDKELVQTQSDEATPPRILPLHPAQSENDQNLADLLLGMGLIDRGTLGELFARTRKLHKSLRNCLLDDDLLTHFQIELIEAGKLDSLVHGRLRIIDKLREGPLETIYRVFDPRLKEEALLRHLSGQVTTVQIDQYKASFEDACCLDHKNLARTYEVMEMAGRPAVLQEWLVGLPSTDWQNELRDASVAIHLLHQAASALTQAHSMKIVHGQLHAGRCLLTAQGELKLCGFGEPAWLLGLHIHPTNEHDLRNFCELALRWMALVPNNSKTISLKKYLEEARFQADHSAADLLHRIESVKAKLPLIDHNWSQLLNWVHARSLAEAA